MVGTIDQENDKNRINMNTIEKIICSNNMFRLCYQHNNNNKLSYKNLT